MIYFIHFSQEKEVAIRAGTSRRVVSVGSPPAVTLGRGRIFLRRVLRRDPTARGAPSAGFRRQLRVKSAESVVVEAQVRVNEERKGTTMQQQKVRIRLQAYDHRVLDQAVGGIIQTARSTGAQVVGPIPLPTRVERYTVNRSPNVDKKSMDQFEMRTHKRLLDIVNPTAQTIDELKKLNLPAGIDITIKV